MARELGWTPPSGPAETVESIGGQQVQVVAPATWPTNIDGVDFVDLRPGDNSVATAPGPAPLQPAYATELPDMAPASSNPIPGFVSGTNLVMAVDSSIVPVGSSLGFWTLSGGEYYAIGRTTLGMGATVVTIPTSSPRGGSFSYMAVTYTAPDGTTATIGQLHLPAQEPP
ncbi:MAG: hypothetical protein M1608_17510 [Candidatus Omnitrophica bacterium]|nr:hypothetical protein [Candidatus Omnitrophota bacterium]